MEHLPQIAGTRRLWFKAPVNRLAHNPLARISGLVGGAGPERVAAHPEPSLVHRWALSPYHDPAHLEAGRAFAAEGLVEVEIGFGRPHFLKQRITDAPERRYFGFEVQREWCEQLCGWLDREGHTNTRVILSDARPLLAELFPVSSVQAFYVFFPDPWWKRRHEERRVVTAEVLEVLHALLAPGGALEVRTDVAAYFERVCTLVRAHGGFDEVPAGVDDRGRTLPLTHREKKCSEVGTPVHRIRAIRR